MRKTSNRQIQAFKHSINCKRKLLGLLHSMTGMLILYLYKLQILKLRLKLLCFVYECGNHRQTKLFNSYFTFVSSIHGQATCKSTKGDLQSFHKLIPLNMAKELPNVVVLFYGIVTYHDQRFLFLLYLE